MSSKKFVVGLLFGISIASLASAAIPQPPNPLTNINLTFDQRLEQMKQTDAILVPKSMTKAILNKTYNNPIHGHRGEKQP